MNVMPDLFVHSADIGLCIDVLLPRGIGRIVTGGTLGGGIAKERELAVVTYSAMWARYSQHRRA